MSFKALSSFLKLTAARLGGTGLVLGIPQAEAGGSKGLSFEPALEVFALNPSIQKVDLESEASLVYTVNLVSKKKSKDSCMVKQLRAEGVVRWSPTENPPGRYWGCVWSGWASCLESSSEGLALCRELV